MSKESKPRALRGRATRRSLGAAAIIGTAISLMAVAVAAGSFGTAQVGQGHGKEVLLPSQQRVTPVSPLSARSPAPTRWPFPPSPGRSRRSSTSS